MDQPIRAAVLTASDTRTATTDVSGQTAVEVLRELGVVIVERSIVADDHDEIAAELTRISDGGTSDLIITTGGTGFAPRDVTPEATLSIVDRVVPGISEGLRRETSTRTPMAMLSRGVAGLRGKTLIINLPGSPNAVRECLAVIAKVLPHAVAQARGDDKH